MTQNFRRFSTHPELQALDGDELMGISSPTTTTTESSEEGSGSGDSDGNGYWSIVYDAIVWIDAFTVSRLLQAQNTTSNKLTNGTNPRSNKQMVTK